MQSNDMAREGSNAGGLVSTDLHFKQKLVLMAIRDLISEQGYPPTVAEISERAAFSSTSVAFYWLQKLEEGGYITKVPGIHRSIQLTQKGQEALA